MRIEDEIKQSHFASEYHKLTVNLLFTSVYFENLYSKIIKPFNITQEQFNVLRILKGQHPEPMGIKDIQSRMINKMSNTSRLIDKLKEKNFVERVACEQDRRAVDITLTEGGLKQLEAINKDMRVLKKEYQTLSEDEARQLNLLLDKLRG